MYLPYSEWPFSALRDLGWLLAARFRRRREIFQAFVAKTWVVARGPVLYGKRTLEKSPILFFWGEKQIKSHMMVHQISPWILSPLRCSAGRHGGKRGQDVSRSKTKSLSPLVPCILHQTYLISLPSPRKYAPSTKTRPCPRTTYSHTTAPVADSR